MIRFISSPSEINRHCYLFKDSPCDWNMPQIFLCLRNQHLDQPEKRETVSVQDLALSNAYQLEAMINVLERKGLLTKAEVLEELKGLRVKE